MKCKQLFNRNTKKFKRSDFLMLMIYTITLFTSCKKLVEIGPPPTEVTTATVFSDSTAAASAMAGVYSQMMASNLLMLNGGATVFPALSADEMLRTSPNPIYDVFTANAIPVNNDLLQNNLWRSTYAHIYQCNAIIEGANRSTNLSFTFKQQLIAEARFDRAFCYFYLANLFGDVPLVTVTDYNVNATLPRTPIQAIFTSIDADLSFAKLYLPPPTVAKNTRPSSNAASAALARVKLYQKDWSAAEVNATACITSGYYTLPNDLKTVFSPSSTETIWQLVPVQPAQNTAEGNVFVPANTTTRPTYRLTPTLLAAFDSMDIRKAIWLKTNTVNGQSYTFPYKYTQRSRTTSGAPPTEYNIILRLAEQYLIRAEARTKQGNFTGANSDLNIIRTRAGLLNSTASDEASLLLAIEKERQREFFAEWGHRWLDLKRTGRADAVLGNTKSGWQATDALYPIPFAEIQNNPSLIQNPGY